MSQTPNSRARQGAAVLVTERRGPCMWLRLCRPAVMNALNPELVDRLSDAIDAIEADDTVRVVVLTGTGRAFCAGADLKALTGSDGVLDPDRVLGLVDRAAATIERLATLDRPVIAGVNGLALAGGLELLLACDIVVASSGALIGDAHANYALVPGAGGSARLPRVIGTQMAKYLALTGACVPPDSPVLAGLIADVVEPEALEPRLSELAASLAAKSPLALRGMKRLIDASPDRSLTDALADERRVLTEQCRSADLVEGIAAFAEKRTPHYQGR